MRSVIDILDLTVDSGFQEVQTFDPCPRNNVGDSEQWVGLHLASFV